MVSIAQEVQDEAIAVAREARDFERREISERLLQVANDFRAMPTRKEQEAAYKWLGEYFDLGAAHP